ncbi:hydroxyethylthiazole kinase [Fructobacillus sp. CRL 2054]|uniref:hydroxyethylthiazole kinase n=1 Tax=Fructobacillus sp. CRL 2054 TaxID=2763007 RepID=UPI002379E22E|nr:hydroxyethylthiazole kinase [Fructobacillus sp. CRL 2054]MDD9138889.1 hydroxyethylthiazole kinase [Fructobacillus sp. CRL 2054]
MKNNKILETMHQQPAMVMMNGNHVTEQLVADVISYLGGSPLVGDDERDDDNLVALASAVVINMGTITAAGHERLIHLGAAAKKFSKPVVFDPVGAGASIHRRKQALDLVDQVQPAVMRGNLSEIAALLSGETSALGIDSTSEADALSTAEAYAKKTGAIIVISGAVDVVTDGQTVYQIDNGHPDLAVNVGMGDALDGILALGLAQGHSLEQVVQAASILPVAADFAVKHPGVEGPATFKNALMDKLATLTDEELIKQANIKKS